MMSEQWRPIVGYEALYEVSDNGQIRSFDRVIERKKSNSYVLKGRIMRTREDKDGYVIVDLNAGHDKRTFKVHRLVASAFIPNPKGLPDVDHDDGIRNHNSVGNLKWTTEKDNLLSRHNVKQASGFRGVRKQSRTPGDQYQAYCFNHVDKRFVHIGVFPTAEIASAKRAEYIAETDNVSTR